MPKKNKVGKHCIEEAKSIDLTKDKEGGKSHSYKNTNVHNINTANISQKNSHGANNWTVFKESLEYQAESKKHQNSKTTCNKPSIPLNKVKKTSNNDSSSTSDTIHSKTVNGNNLKSVEDKIVVGLNENKPLMKKHFEAERNILTKHIAMDCEMVGVEVGVNNNMLARVSLVNSFGECVYDKFVKPTEPVLDYRTNVSGVRCENLEDAEDFTTVQTEVANIIKGKVLVGHALKNDFKVLFLSHPRYAIRDTSKFKKFREGGTPSLKKLAMKYLGVSIQDGEHSSVQDALATMQLYRMFKKEWEASLRTPGLTMKRKGNKMINSHLMKDY